MTDPRIVAGMKRQNASRRGDIDAGSRPIGWKVGFGSSAGQSLLGIESPLVGYLTTSTLASSQSQVDVTTWVNAVVEFEIAARLDADGEVTSIAPAIELADVDLSPLDHSSVEETLARNIFHRVLVLGAQSDSIDFDTISTLEARIIVDGAHHTLATDLDEYTGPYRWVLANTIATIAETGTPVADGDVVIMGSVIPPVPAHLGSEYVFHLGPFDPISINITP